MQAMSVLIVVGHNGCGVGGGLKVKWFSPICPRAACQAVARAQTPDAAQQRRYITEAVVRDDRLVLLLLYAPWRVRETWARPGEAKR